MTRRPRAPQRAVEPEQLPLFGRPASPAPRARYASADIALSRVFAPPGMVDAEVDAVAVRAWRESVADVVRAIGAARSIGEAERARVAGYEWGQDAAAFIDALAASLDGALTPRGPVNVAPLRAASKRLLAVLAWPITPAREAPEARRWARFEAERSDITATITDASAAVWRAAVRALGAVGGRAFVWVPRAVAHEVAGWPVVIVGESGSRGSCPRSVHGRRPSSFATTASWAAPTRSRTTPSGGAPW